ncbi:MAG: HIT family protein [Treponema sp.]|nr:HIT family protein [Treponema sp.]
MSDDCIFCKIIKGEIPSYKIYEDDYTYAFLDIAKDVDGHTLVIPKKHVRSMLECEPEDMTHVMNSVQKISRHFIDDCGYGGVNLFNCTNECAHQSVFHFHMHIIPRKEGDGIRGVPPFTGAKLPIEEMYEKLKM